MPKFRSNRRFFTVLFCAQQAIFCGPPRPDELPVQHEEKIPSVAEVRARLRSNDAAERGMAAAEVLRYSYRELTGELFKILKHDPSDNARTAAAIALAALGEQKAGATIAAMLRAQKGQPDLLVESLGELRNAAHAAAAVPLLKHRDTMVRLKAAEALGRMQAKSEGDAILVQAKKQEAAEVIEAHVIALGNIGYSAAEDFIIATAQKNPQSTLAAASLNALGKFKSRKAVPLLLQALRGTDAKLQENAAEALRRIADAKAAAGLFEIFASEAVSAKGAKPENNETALLAIDILAEYPVRLTQSKAQMLLNGNQKQLYAGAAFILGKLKDRAARERIETVLRDKTTPNREMVARALGYLQMQESIAVLREVAREAEGSARYGAVWSLGIMAAREALPEIRNAVQSADKQFAAYGLEALAAMPGEEDLPLLERILTGDDGNQLLAASAIARTPGERARRMLEQAAASKKPAVRAAGFEGLLMRSDKAAIPFLMQQLETGDAETRKLVIAVLRGTTGQKFDSAAAWFNWYQKQGK